MRGGLFGNAALATVFVVPALTLQGGGSASLSDALQRTLAALDSLGGLEARVAAREPGAVEAVLSATEPALPLELRSDGNLTELRGEVSRLERELDGLHAQSETHVPGHTGSQSTRDADLGPLPVATTGLDETTRQMLSTLRPGGPTVYNPALSSASAQTQPGAKAQGKSVEAKQAFEPAGYAADALRLARAYYKQGRWSDALALLENRKGTPAETYWSARCLEKLGRNDEAVRAYEAVVADPSAGEDAARAREDLEFLRWRLEFAARQKASAGKGSK